MLSKDYVRYSSFTVLVGMQKTHDISMCRPQATIYACGQFKAVLILAGQKLDAFPTKY